MHVSECIAMQMNLMAVPEGGQWMYRGCCSDVWDKSERLIRARLHAQVKICKGWGGQSEPGSDSRCSPPQLIKPHLPTWEGRCSHCGLWWYRRRLHCVCFSSCFTGYFSFVSAVLASVRQWQKISRLNVIKLFEEVESAQGRRALPLITKLWFLQERRHVFKKPKEVQWVFFLSSLYNIYFMVNYSRLLGRVSLYSVSGADLLHWSIIDMSHCSASRTFASFCS